ncbi:MAG TPA: HWE histidine kinase domain-containing protein [Allosphingosinicella sp.]|jgi:PAS domain S-box-containing protein
MAAAPGEAGSGQTARAYAAAVLYTLAALAFRLALDPYLAGVQYITFFAAVIAIAYLYGIGPGLVAAILGALASWYFLVPERYSFRIDDPAQGNTLILFFVVACATVVLLGRARGVTRELLATERALGRSEQRYRDMFEQVNDIVFTADLDQNITDCNQAAARAVGAPREALIGRNIAEFVSPEGYEETSRRLREKLERGGNTQYDIEVRSRTGRQLHWEINSGLAADADGRVIGLFAIGRDVTERRAAEQRQQLLVNELNHRVKNTLAIVQALAQQSFKGAGLPPAMREAFEGRLSALSAAHNLLTDQHWQAASIRQIVRDGASFPGAGEDRVTMEGPDLLLPPQTAVGLALAVHELTTNAVKYGALSVAEGRVAITWRTEGERLNLVWEEQGGPPVEPPRRSGFGTRLIERALAAELGGRAVLSFRPEGVRCEVDAPLPHLPEAG